MRILLSIFLLLLTSCYEPMYGTKTLFGPPSVHEAQLNSVAITGINGENGQKLRNFLIDRFYGQGRPADPRYRLDIVVTPLEEKLGLQKDATTTRARLTLTAKVNLTDMKTQKSVFTTTSIATVSHNILDDQYATLSSKEDAYERGMRELSELITTRILLYFDQQGDAK